MIPRPHGLIEYDVFALAEIADDKYTTSQPASALDEEVGIPAFVKLQRTIIKHRDRILSESDHGLERAGHPWCARFRPSPSARRQSRFKLNH